MAKNGAGVDPGIEDVPNNLNVDTPICDVCGMEVIINLNIYNLTGMCGVCSTGESDLLFTDED